MPHLSMPLQQTNSRNNCMTRYRLAIMTIILIVGLGSSAPACPNIELEGYKFELSKIKPKMAQAGKQIVSFSCSITWCDSSTIMQNKNQNGYVLGVNMDNLCVSYTSNYTGPLLSAYNLLDSKEPRKGISFSYLPKAYTKQEYDASNNQTIRKNYMNSVKIKLYCSQSEQKFYCSKNGQTTNIGSEWNYQRNLDCDLYLPEGCPTLAVNHFWTFLIHRSIVFAVVIWVCGLFLIILGYLAIRVTILLYGVFTGAFFGVIFVSENYVNFYLEFDGIFIFVICVSVLLGILFGVSLLTVPKLGYINIGVFVAAIFTLLLQNSVLYLTGSLLAFYITFGVSALAMAIVALMELRYFIIICSSFTGAFLLIRPLGFFLPGYPNELISGKNFLISVSTPWQFYLFLGSILILTGIGIAIQKCINDKVGRVKVNGHYYLEQDGSVRDKLKKIFEFKEIKEMIKAGKKQIIQLKNMITDDKNQVHFTEQFGDQEIDHGPYIEMERMQKIQRERKSDKSKEETRVPFVAPKGKKEKKRNSESVESVQINDQLESINDSEDEQPKKNDRSKRK